MFRTPKHNKVVVESTITSLLLALSLHFIYVQSSSHQDDATFLIRNRQSQHPAGGDYANNGKLAPIHHYHHSQVLLREEKGTPGDSDSILINKIEVNIIRYNNDADVIKPGRLSTVIKGISHSRPKRELLHHLGDKSEAPQSSMIASSSGDIAHTNDLGYNNNVEYSHVDSSLFSGGGKSLGGSVHSSGGVNNISTGGSSTLTRIASSSRRNKTKGKNNEDRNNSRLILRLKTTTTTTSDCDNNHYQENPKRRHPNFMNSIRQFVLDGRRQEDGSQTHNNNPKSQGAAAVESLRIRSQATDETHTDSSRSNRYRANGPKIKDSSGVSSPEEPKSLLMSSIIHTTTATTAAASPFPHDLQVRSEPTSIQCLCDTLDCFSIREPTCRTFGSCYTQTLDMPNGSVSIIRGCISGPTSLLCENRRPKMVKRWPFLKCCKVEMCNWDKEGAAHIYEKLGKAVPPQVINDMNATESVPASQVAHYTENALHTNSTGVTDRLPIADSKRIHHTMNNERNYHDAALQFSTASFEATYEQYLNETRNANILRDKGLHERFLSEHTLPLISPLAAAFLSAGAILIIVISAVGFWILRKESRNIERRSWGAMDLPKRLASYTRSYHHHQHPERSTSMQDCSTFASHGVSNPVLSLEDCPKSQSTELILSIETCLVHSATNDKEIE